MSAVPAISIHLLTCPGREQSLADTLASWARTDWAFETPRIHHGATPPDPSLPHPERALIAGQNVFRAFSTILREALTEPADAFLLLEDDLTFCRHIRAAIHAWAPFREGKAGVSHFYDPGFPITEENPAEHWRIIDSWSVFGSQARLFTREAAEWLLPRYTLASEHHDQQTARLTALRWPLYYHAPSLVQHTAIPSTWGGGAHHSARDFEEGWEPG